MNIQVNIPNALARVIIERGKEYAEELGRKLNSKDKQKLVGTIITDMFRNENDSYYSSSEHFAEWRQADAEGENIFEKLVKRCSTKE